MISVLADMEFEGINISTDTLKVISKEMAKQSKILEENIYTTVNAKFNISSPKQLGYILFEKLKLISNKFRFRIIELTQNDTPNISELSSRLKLSYTKCADYVKLLEKHNLVEKIRDGKKIKIKSKVRLNNNKIEF